MFFSIYVSNYQIIIHASCSAHEKNLITHFLCCVHAFISPKVVNRTFLELVILRQLITFHCTQTSPWLEMFLTYCCLLYFP